MQYNKNLEKLQESTGNVVVEKVNETIQLKETYQKDKEFFEQKYYDLNTENEELKREKERLQSELNSLKGELENQKSRFDTLQAHFQQVQNSLMADNEQISKLIARTNELCKKLKEAGGNDEKC
ncbi:hypothetical protein J4448_06230 [Candidatus Woesearchaeota archaeon]|nr:hypothetical protein [Candidatus Woesearchaeota archaeon]